MKPQGRNEHGTQSTCNPGSALDDALAWVELEIREGLAHGFFEMTVAAEIVPGKKRRLTIRAGKSYQFVIPHEELEG